MFCFVYVTEFEYMYMYKYSQLISSEWSTAPQTVQSDWKQT